MAFSERECRLRAELAAELGYIPASLAPGEIERHRRLNAAADRSTSQERVGRKYAHIREQKRRAEVEMPGVLPLQNSTSNAHVDTAKIAVALTGW
jgi:hypothetical protein